MHGTFEPPPREGLSTGAKIAIGCGALLLVFVLAAGLIVAYFQKMIQEETGGARAHEQAQATLEQLAADYPFERPADGVEQAAQAETFFAVTEEVWSEAEPWIDDVNRALQNVDRRDSGAIRNTLDGARAMARLMRIRLLLADALAAHDVSGDEYAWTGARLLEAREELLYEATGQIIPEANVELARADRAELGEFSEPASFVGKEWILAMAGTVAEMPDFWEILRRSEN
jgi:hypothetical protein